MCNKNNKKVIIIGGGPAGLTAAYKLSRENVESIVLEKDQIVGGISKTVNYKNYYFDLGGHRFFTKIRAVDKMWREVLGNNFLRRKRLSRIYFNKRFFYYPLRPLNTLFGLGLTNSFLIFLSYLHSNLFPSKQENTFEQWVSNRFGKRLYRTFFKTYTEKVWGIPCNEIMAEWAAQRIKGLSLIRAVKSALINPQNRIKTLINTFDYPKLGPGMMWGAVADIIERNGSQVWLNAEAEKIFWKNNKIESIEINLKHQPVPLSPRGEETRMRGNEKKTVVSGRHFISSMPVRELIQKFDPPVPEDVLRAANNLKYRDFLTVALVIDKADLFPDNWIYIHEPGVKVGRIQNFKNWSPYMVPDPDRTCLGLEYFCFEEDELWKMPDEQLIELAKKELEILGLGKGSEVRDGNIVRVPKAYPIYDSNYKKYLQTVRQFLKNINNLQVVGRNGMHRYNNQDHSMLTAMLAVENISGKKHNLWEVNEEKEYHEEEIEIPGKEVLPDSALIQTFARMDKFGFAVALGSVSGLLIFLATLSLLIKGGEVIGPNLILLEQYFTGYTITVSGAFIGFGYSFLWGFLSGWLFAYLRNFFLGLFIYRVKKKTEILSFKDFLDHF